MEALRRISELELDESSLQNLIQCMQDLRMTMVRQNTFVSQTVTRITHNSHPHPLFCAMTFSKDT